MQPDQQPSEAQPQTPQNPQQQDVPPAQTPPTDPPQMVYVTRPHEPVAPHITDGVRAKHEESKRKFPSLNLSDGEYVISAVRRHPIGLLPIFGIVGIVLVMLAAAIPLYDSTIYNAASNAPSTAVIAIIAFLLAALFLIGGYIAVYVYVSNKFFLTNESVIQEIQTSLFAKHEQTVSLMNIEDASYQQSGVLPHIFNYGSIRLSTEGDETTYLFSYVANPKKEIATLNNAVEAFKNGRPVHND